MYDNVFQDYTLWAINNNAYNEIHKLTLNCGNDFLILKYYYLYKIFLKR